MSVVIVITITLILIIVIICICYIGNSRTKKNGLFSEVDYNGKYMGGTYASSVAADRIVKPAYEIKSVTLSEGYVAGIYVSENNLFKLSGIIYSDTPNLADKAIVAIKFVSASKITAENKETVFEQ